jgi:hypothetical protein
MSVSVSNMTAPLTADNFNKTTIALKNSHASVFVHSCSVEYDATTVCQTVPFTDIASAFTVLSTWTEDDVKKYGPGFGVAIDSADSIKYDDQPTVNGNGYINTANNTGLIQRQKDSIKYPFDAGNKVYRTEQDNRRIGEPYYKVVDGKPTYCYLLKFRLRDLASSFFKNIPICKMSNMKITIVFNSASVVINSLEARAASEGVTARTPGLTVLSYQQVSGGVCPFLVTAQPVPGAYSFTVSNKIDSSIFNVNSCRLYVNAYTYQPSIELSILKSPITKFSYNDVITFEIKNINGAFNSVISNGTIGIQSILLVPTIAAKSGAVSDSNTHLYPQYQSPFDTSPGTTAPYVALSDLNIMIAGENLLISNQLYDYEQYQSELSDASLHGLISEAMFRSSYRYYYFNCSRKALSQDNVPKSITVSGSVVGASTGVAPNIVNETINLLCFVFHKKTLSLDTVTGKLISNIIA